MEDYIYEIMSANDEVLDTDFVCLDSAIEFAEQMTCPQCMFQLVVEKALGFAVVAEALECA